MRCPKCFTETPPEAMQCPGCNLVTPKGKAAEKKASVEKQKLVADRRKQKGKVVWKANRQKVDWKSIDWKNWRTIPFKSLIPSWALWAVTLVILCVSAYFAYRYVQPKEISLEEAKATAGLMTRLRNMPSKKEGMTLDQCMMDEVKKSRESGQLVSYTGWSVKPYNPNQFLISFSYEEKAGLKSAEWVADPVQSVFVPQSELAMAMHKSK
ncbi:MAG: hypothetical protein AB1757_12215 [Acidobacteriota bacterium]